MGYKEGEEVYFDFGNGIKGAGKIRGLAWQGVINMWIIEPNDPLSDAYEWSCTVIPEGCLKPVVKHSSMPPPVIRSEVIDTDMTKLQTNLKELDIEKWAQRKK